MSQLAHAKPTASHSAGDAEATPNPWVLASELLVAVESHMQRLAFGTQADPLGAIATDQLLSGGRRLRARLALATLSALGGEASDGVGWASACELLHNASLIHDDLQDGDTRRRGRTTTWAAYGCNQAINAGDLLLMLAYRAVGDVPVADAQKWRLVEALSEYAVRAVRGQAAEPSLLIEHSFDWTSYVQVIEGKTAALIALPVYGAALIAGRPAGEAHTLAHAYLLLGVIFQLQDDIVDIYGDKGRDVRGADLREGKVSALIVEHLARCPFDQEELVAILETPREEVTDVDVARVVELFNISGALDGVLHRITRISRDVRSEIARFQCRALTQVTEDVLRFALAPIKHILPHANAGGAMISRVP